MAKPGDGSAELIPGLYEQLLTESLSEALAEGSVEHVLNDLEPDEVVDFVARYLQQVAIRTLNSVPESRGPAARVEIVNQLVQVLERWSDESKLGDRIALPPRSMWAIARRNPRTGKPELPERPTIPLNESDLLVNSTRELSVGTQIQKELDSADRIDLICAFIGWGGLRILLESLARAVERGAQIRVVTTTYLGATSARALDALLDIGADVRINYESAATRLHAKAWLFHRNSGFSTGLVGSSNLSPHALHDGLEWNVRLSQTDAHAVLDRFRSVFETYWRDDQFEPYSKDQAGRLEKALSREGQARGSPLPITVDIHPFPHQQRVLERLTVERDRHERHRNLVVMATGTGKTVVAALDYRELAQKAGSRPSLLFVAHQQRILEQALATYRHAMTDGAFGSLWTGQHAAGNSEHLFATIQTVGRKLEQISPNAFDVVVIDEFHHAEAPTYKALIEHLRPNELLALTATPERTDGTDVRDLVGGRLTEELRVWDAIELGLLAPFQYFGISDGTDLRQLQWRRGRYQLADLSSLYTGDQLRVGKIIRGIEETVEDPTAMKALGYCVSVQHAEFMAAEFERRGIPARSVTGSDVHEERSELIDQLVRGDLRTLFTVDLFNEGVDIPEVDTLLLLRPTESPTLFLQQLGRGLRRSHGKRCLTVLDFIGQQRKEFRWDRRYRVLTGVPRKRLVKEIDEGFPYLPAGCAISLDRVAEEQVLAQVKTAVRRCHSKA